MLRRSGILETSHVEVVSSEVARMCLGFLPRIVCYPWIETGWKQANADPGNGEDTD